MQEAGVRRKTNFRDCFHLSIEVPSHTNSPADACHPGEGAASAALAPNSSSSSDMTAVKEKRKLELAQAARAVQLASLYLGNSLFEDNSMIRKDDFGTEHSPSRDSRPPGGRSSHFLLRNHLFEVRFVISVKKTSLGGKITEVRWKLGEMNFHVPSARITRTNRQVEYFWTQPTLDVKLTHANNDAVNATNLAPL